MASVGFTDSMARNILTNENNSTRFETFCCAVMSLEDGTKYMPTSTSWDLGRDGRPIGRHFGGAVDFIACSLREDVTLKIKEDVTRITENADLTALRYCSSQPLSEDRIEKIKAEIQEQWPSITDLHVDGSIQLSELIVRDEQYADLFNRFYGNELNALKTALATGASGAQSHHLLGMRIALTTQLSHSGDKLRSEVMSNLILTALSSGDKSQAILAKNISEQLHLGSVISPAYVSHNIQELIKSKHVELRDSAYGLTPDGRKAIEELTARGSENLTEGQKLIRQALEELVGRQVSSDDYSKVWRVLQDGISEMFFKNGINVIAAVSSLATQDAQVSDCPDLSSMVSALGKKVEIALLGGPIAQDIGQAVVDVFHDKRTPAFEWLTTLCASYVAMCSIGLDPTSQQAIVGRLKTLDLLFDTDIVLTLLCEGEPENKTVSDALSAWKRVAGRVFIAIPVLEEVAYHAFISENDFREVFHQLPDYSELDAGRYITNAFVRTYWTLCDSPGLPDTSGAVDYAALAGAFSASY